MGETVSDDTAFADFEHLERLVHSGFGLDAPPLGVVEDHQQRVPARFENLRQVRQHFSLRSRVKPAAECSHSAGGGGAGC